MVGYLDLISAASRTSWGNPVQLRCRPAADDHRVARITDVDPAALSEQIAPRLLLQLPPALESPLQQGDVRGPFEVGLPDDPAPAVRRALIVGGPKVLQAEDVQPRAASVWTAADPIDPTPTTITS